MKRVATLFICSLSFVLSVHSQPGITISLKSLLNEIVNQNSLTRFDGPQYQLMQTSSWDRSELEGKSSKGWFGNKDYDNYIRKEIHGDRTEYVIMDAKGPGAITKWRIPLAGFLGNRIVRIYLDGNPKPVIEENYQKFINGSSFVKWPFAFTSSDEKDSRFQYSMPVGLPKQMGADFYFPLPFSKSCKVTLDDSVFYYNIAYRMYKPGTKVISFTKADFYKNIALVHSTGQKLLAANKMAANMIQKTGTIKKDQIIEIDLPPGPNAIRQIYLHINSKNNKQMNRATVLEVNADGKQIVWSPVSEFFGGGVYARPVKNRNLEVTPDGWMISDWTMPYKSSAKIIIKNYGSEPVKAELKVKFKNYHWDVNSMYFHADWHEEAPLSTPSSKDWNYIKINGKGRYVGDILTIYSVPKNWWGEGDEKIYINGEPFPSQLGTGLEDYYGYAWGFANYFNSPFISMPSRDARGKDNWSGYSTAARIRLLDDIPFNTSLKVDMEAIIPVPGVSYSVTCFWYGMNSTYSNIKPDTSTIIRKLPAFAGFTMQEKPGKPFPDPPSNKLLLQRKKGLISYAGDEIDLLAWRDKKVNKRTDADRDNILGSEGYCIFGNKIITTYAFVADTVNNLPDFITDLHARNVITQSGGAYLYVPGKHNEMYQTGLIEVPRSIAEKGLVSFKLGKSVPSSFRMGIMLDNASSFIQVGKYLWITGGGNSSGKVLLVPSNRVPDWYFFDIKGLKPGDVITVHGSTSKNTDTFSIGGLTFDVNKK
ncbi:MAG TPA: glycoside hydrolase family 172 protein [Hanamia sp.]|nr:glycoside hydrolase family 172 protein [Hanamia sp.]